MAMKKYLALMIFGACGLQGVMAQDQGTTFQKFGVVAGANFSHMNFNKGVPRPPEHVKTNWKPGVFFGFTLQVPVTDNLSIQPQYLFSRLGGEVGDSGIDYQLNYFSMPVFLRYQFSPRVAVMAGPQLDLLINAKKDSSGRSYNITHDTEERSFGVVAGVDIGIWNALGVNLRFMQGLNHIGIGQRSELKEFKYELLQAGMSFRF